MLKLTNTKIVLTGSIIEAYYYPNKPLAYGFNAPIHKIRRKIIVIDDKSRLQKLESKKRSMRRAMSGIRGLVNANAWQWKNPTGIPYKPIFATLTFKNDIRDIKEANSNFSHFIKRLNYIAFNGSKKCTLKYLSVIEFQDLNRKGVIHYHVIFFNLPVDDIDIISKAWAQGFVDRKEIDEIDNVGSYISKNILSCLDDNRLDGNKHYFASRGLLQPIEIREQNKAQTIINCIPREYIAKEDNFNGYQGEVRHVYYKLDRNESLFEIIPELNNLL
jgi:hypothetical protein